MNKVNISEPVYLDSSYNNIPLLEKWNTSVSAALDETSKEIEKLGVNVVDLEIEKNDDLQEFNGSGSIGYAYPSKSNTSYYYVEFETSEPYSEAIKSLYDALLTYAETTDSFKLSKTSLDVGIDREVTTLRAFFVEDMSR
jgi:hypothetical protein